jgi:hypothetical protein
LAVASTFAGKELGCLMINPIVSIISDGCRFIIVDAYKDASGFYLKNDFNYLSADDEVNPSRTD